MATRQNQEKIAAFAPKQAQSGHVADLSSAKPSQFEAFFADATDFFLR